MAAISGMKLVTDLGQEFEQIKFQNELSYLIIDYQKCTCFSMSHKLSKEEFEVANDIMSYCSWLDIGEKAKEKLRKNW